MIMIDLETLGTRPGDAIISLAAVKFDREFVGDQLFGTIDLDQPKMRIFGSTIKWWMRQSDEARMAAFPEQPTWGSLETALTALDEFYDGTQVWSHGAAFDIVMLETAYYRLGKRPPWGHRKIRDTRTVYELRPHINPEFIGEKHNCLHDCLNQITHLQLVLRDIG